MTLEEAVKTHLKRMHDGLKAAGLCDTCTPGRTCKACNFINRTTNSFLVDLQFCENPEIRMFVRGESTDAGVVDYE